MNETSQSVPKVKEFGSLLKAEDVAKVLNISLSFAFQLIQRGEIRAVRIGRSVRVRPADLEAYIAANTQ
jgi:excisionase family DNA binding protein